MHANALSVAEMLDYIKAFMAEEQKQSPSKEDFGKEAHSREFLSLLGTNPYDWRSGILADNEIVRLIYAEIVFTQKRRADHFVCEGA